MDTQKAVYTDTGILLRLKKKEGHSDTCDNRDGPRRHGVARTKPGRKRQMPYEAPGKRSLE